MNKFYFYHSYIEIPGQEPRECLRLSNQPTVIVSALFAECRSLNHIPQGQTPRSLIQLIETYAEPIAFVIESMEVNACFSAGKFYTAEESLTHILKFFGLEELH